MPFHTLPPPNSPVAVVTYVVPMRARAELAEAAREAAARRGITLPEWTVIRERHPDGPVVADMIAALSPDIPAHD